MIYNNKTIIPAHEDSVSVKSSGSHCLPETLLEGNIRNEHPEEVYTQKNNPNTILLDSIVSEPPGDFAGQSDPSGADKPLQEKPDKRIRILLADDHQMMRAGLRKIIEEEKDLTIIAEAADGEEAIKLAHDTSPDVIVMDVNMPGMSGIQATRKIISDNRNARIIGLSLYDNQDVAQSMKSAGASAYLTKTDAIEALCATIRNEANNSRK